MNSDDTARTMRASAVRLNHRLRRFAGANAVKKIALNVIARVSEAQQVWSTRRLTIVEWTSLVSSSRYFVLIVASSTCSTAFRVVA